MTWQTVLTPMLRGYIGDIDTPQTYTDFKLQTLLLYAAQTVNTEVGFGAPLTIGILTGYQIDVNASSIYPDPTISMSGGYDNGFLNLTVLQAACLLTRSEMRPAAITALSVKDGISNLDLRDVFKAKQALAKQFCEDYVAARDQYRYNTLATGKATLGPFSSEFLYSSPHSINLEFF